MNVLLVLLVMIAIYGYHAAFDRRVGARVGRAFVTAAVMAAPGLSVA